MLGYAVVSSLLRGDFAPIKHSVYVGLFVLSGGWIATANKLAAIRDKVFYFIWNCAYCFCFYSYFFIRF